MDVLYKEIRDGILTVESEVEKRGKFTIDDMLKLVSLGVPPSRILASIDFRKLQKQLTIHILELQEEL